NRCCARANGGEWALVATSGPITLTSVHAAVATIVLDRNPKTASTRLYGEIVDCASCEKGTVMRRILAVVAFVAFSQPVLATGLLIPTEKKLPPLAMLNHHVQVSIEDQVAVTKIEQTFRNHTDRQLEATYIFPVPKGASV